MKINALENINNKYTAIIPQKKQTTERSNFTYSQSVYPQNYYVSFGIKPFNSIYSEYKDTEMPVTVKDFIENQELLLSDKEFEAFTSLGIKGIQRLAFKELEDCYSIADIHKNFPNETEFSNLKEIKDVESDSKFYSTMRKLEEKGIKTLTCKEDITTFTVKKIYFEGKTYKDTLNDLAEVISPEASELKEFLKNYTTPRSAFFTPLGFTPPNGHSYGRDLQYSDPNFFLGRKEYFRNLTPEEVNEKIQKLLENNEKSRFAMMDAWNHCENIRNDLSKHLIDRIGSINGGSFDFYDPSFYSKMKFVMNEFWQKYPDYKKELGNEIKLALDKYDRLKAGKPEDFEAYKTEIKKKSQEIRNKIHLARESEHPVLSIAEKMLQKIVQKANPMTLRTGNSNKDFYNLLMKKTSEKEIEILEGNTTTEEYQKLFPEGIKDKMRSITKTSEYINLFNAQNIAILRELQVDGSLNDDSLNAILFRETPFNVQMKEIVSENENLNIDNVNRKYDRFKNPLSTEEKEKVKKALLENNPDFKTTDTMKLDGLLKNQGQYTRFILGDDGLKNITQVLFWKEFDRLHGTDYTERVLKRINSDLNINSAINVIDDIDFTDIID